jgi:CRP-like cAMP-binding protein
MDSNNRFRYTTLSEGSFFGEMSLLLNEENEYSYAYNLYDKNVMMLFIDCDTFLRICK